MLSHAIVNASFGLSDARVRTNWSNMLPFSNCNSLSLKDTLLLNFFSWHHLFRRTLQGPRCPSFPVPFGERATLFCRREKKQERVYPDVRLVFSYVRRR